MTPIPHSADAMTTEWLTAALRQNGRLEPDVHVTAIGLEPIGDVVGVFGTVHRVTPSFSAPTQAPATMVAKFPTGAVENKNVGMALDLYAREIRALRLVAARTPALDYARVVHAEMDPEAGAFALLIDEVVGRTVGDQVAGLTRTQTETLADALASMHAHWWDDRELSTSEWLPRTDHPVQMAVVPGIIRSAMPVVADRFGARIGDEALAIGARVADQYESIMTRMSARARTFAHTDIRAVNLFFDDDGGNVCIIDWQLCTWSNPMQDLIYLYGSSVTVDDFESWGIDVMHRYHDRLVARLADRGIDASAYTWDDLWHDAQLVSLWSLVAPASTVGTFEMGNDLGARISEVWVDRAFRLPIALGAANLLA